ncbi:hypothetical protein BLS_002883 [Venturia inaequalis]|uniref:Uncharacterized protein n=1 Tax=Venturia inaequalis TaxID=5025 RepID=A0A8H3UQU4_VENIN|nr:hypothetical protein EG328_004267 [Venturia inaequalis]KAE9974831.1 hypothetical protein BLS_002883 [Venturia inaequalis]KAE9989591.1 hypothetical protein EG327_002468 [Venturia inaequalis]RDI78130.1 hypothetical protein Vi05172_g11895 [Venturia inaequalis]
MAPQTSKQWTVARCNRLMRPLVTKLRVLRLLRDEKTGQPIPVVRSKAPRKPAASDFSSDEEDKPASKDKDPDWLSGPKKKKATKAYASRPTNTRDPSAEIGVRTPAKKAHNLRPGELSIPTPYLARNTSYTSDGSAASSYTTKNNTGKTPSRVDSGADIGERPKKMKKFMADGEDEQAVTSNVMKLYADILHATTESPDPNEQQTSSPVRGARSLWAMCCSKFGAAIAEVEADPDPEEDGLLDMGTVYYGMAEDLELPVRAGGQLQLRLIVRAHATSIMAVAVQEGLIEAKVLRKYLSHLVQPIEDSGHAPSPREAEALVSVAHTLVSPWSDEFRCSKTHYNHFFMAITNSVMALTPVLSKSQRFGFICRQFMRILGHRDFPVEWVAARRMMPLWKDILRTILNSKSDNDVQDAFELLRQTSSHALGLEPTTPTREHVLSEYTADFVSKAESCPRCPRPGLQAVSFLANYSAAQQGIASQPKWTNLQLADALSNTLSSMSTMFSSFSIAYHNDSDMLSDVNAQFMLFGLNLLAIDILQHHATRAPAATAARIPKIKARRTISVLIATVLPQIAGCQPPSGLAFASVNDVVRLMKKVDSEARTNASDSNTVLDCLPELVCSIARGVSQLSKADAFDTLRTIVHFLASPRIDGQKLSQSTLLFLKQLAFSSAHYFAESSEDPSHYSLIAEIEKQVGQSEHFDMSRTPFRSSKKAQSETRGFKWEEGICEWVLASPKHNPPPKPVETPKKVGKYSNMFEFTSSPAPIEDEDNLPSTPATEVEDTSIKYLCNLIESSSPPLKWEEFMIMHNPMLKNKLTLEPEEESDRIQNIDVDQMKVPLLGISFPRLKRSPPLDSDSSDDELSFHGPKSRKRPSSSNLRSSSSGPSRSKSRGRLPRNAEFDDSEDELGFT